MKKHIYVLFHSLIETSTFSGVYLTYSPQEIKDSNKIYFFPFILNQHNVKLSFI